jgi:hypothetical protein
MTRPLPLPAAAIVLAAVLACGCNDKAGPSGTGAAPADKTVAAPPTTAPAAPTPAPTPAAPAPSASSDAAPDGSADAALSKKWGCGAKDQKPCPMQGWMKKVMATASSGGDGDKLAQALTYVATHAPPGYPKWTDLAKAGAAKAKAGDIDGAKASCKECHDAYKDNYKATMRDRPF